jgi:hypothetical protein
VIAQRDAVQMVTLYAVLPSDVQRAMVHHLNHTRAEELTAVAQAWSLYCRDYYAPQMAALTDEQRDAALVAMIADMQRDSAATRDM